MLGHKSVRANFGSYLAVTVLFLASASITGAQTQTGPTEAKPTATSADPAPIAANAKTPAISAEGDPAKAAANRVKSEAQPVDAKTGAPGGQIPAPPPKCERTINADVMAIPQPIMLNRLGAAIPDGLIFALRSDIDEASNRLKAYKRPRPLVLRANVGDCLRITFTNSIPVAKFETTTGVSPDGPVAPTATTEVSLHIQGVEWVTGTKDDGSFVGLNPTSLANPPPPNTNPPTPASPPQVYTLYAKNEGTFLLYTTGDSALGSQLGRGLFGALNVQPKGAEWYRSQVTADDLQLVTIKPTKDGHPTIKYDQVYPPGHPRAGVPILKMLDADRNIVHSDLTAIITGPRAGRFPGTTGVNNPEPPCNAENNPALKTAVDPLFCSNPASPDRKQPYREATIIYHEVGAVASQAFPVANEMQMTLNAGFDGFAINYGTGGIGAEVYANRIGVGPMGDCVDCKFEEFFLSAWSVGDPAMLVDKPANALNQPPPPPSPAAPVIPSTSATQWPCSTADFEGTATQPPNPACANARKPTYNGEPYTLAPLAKAKRAYYSDDPSNVYHSYINDHIKFRILHGGSAVGVTHVHHQHAHQWLQSPNSDESSYLDSQMISPGASYTLEMVYNGSGNRNKVVGDSIFHCHFYPHFAAGMWAMWRTHDVFESGTFVYPQGKMVNNVDVSGQAVPGSRALPDGEIVAGSPTPAVVPLPTLPMAPLPAYAQIKTNVTVQGAPTTWGGQVVIGATCAELQANGFTVSPACNPALPTVLNGTVIGSQFNGTQMTGTFQRSAGNALLNPGFPYFIPGIAGARAPHPPLDFAPDGAGGFMDGGLPRHLIAGGSISYERHTAFDWSKDLETVNAVKLPETGTPIELAAINFFKQRCHKTFLPDGTPSNCLPSGFFVNGLPLGPQPGAPFADPAVNDAGNAVGLKRRYKAAAFQLDVTFNKKGWHFPQQRMLSLWEDVAPTLGYKPGGTGGRQPEPLFFRGNSGDVIEYWHTNLVPNYYLVDDFQVRTPTDILGQHIHLVKFDVTASDGAGNGFNYEDGTFSPQEVQEMIHAINNSASKGFLNAPNQALSPKAPPKEIYNCATNPNDPRCTACPNNWTPTYRPQCPSWLGAQTTIQRWYLDPLVDNSGVDRTMRTVFTHDHFGPSTHQQAGLYAGLLIEPRNSTWKNSEDGTVMGRPANLPPIRPDGGPTSWKADIWTGPNYNASYREFALEFQDLQLAYTIAAIGSTTPKTAPDPNPSLGWRDPLFAINPARDGSNQARPRLISTGNSPPTGTQSVNYLNDPIPWRVGQFGDLSYAYDNAFKLASNAPPNGDPSTPLLRAYQDDDVQIRVLVGAHVFAHQFNLEGPTWFSEPSWKNSGYRSAQAMGLSEHFELLFKVPPSSAPSINRKCPDGMSQANCVDYLYSPSLDETGVANGMWGLFRSYAPTIKATKLQPLPNNPINANVNVTYATCPATLRPPAVKRVFNIAAVTAQNALSNISPVPGSNPLVGQIVFNSRGSTLTSTNGVLYVRTEDLNAQGKLKAGVPVEPLILRANAGDCIEVNLTNVLAPTSAVFSQNFKFSPPFSDVPVQSKMSSYVGLHPQLLSYDAATSYGFNVGWNSVGQPNQAAAFGGNNTVKYTWYAGKIDRAATGKLTYMPVEFGALNLFPSDPVFQNINGLFASMIIEPQGSTVTCDAKDNDGNLIAVPCDPTPGFDPNTVKEYTRASGTVTDKNTKFREFAMMISDNLVISGGNTSAVNYRTEPRGFRFGCGLGNLSCMKSNQLIQKGPAPACTSAGQVNDPQTPVFTAGTGETARFRMTHPFGTGTSQVFTLHGHVWQRNPYKSDSKAIGDQTLSQWLGSRDNHGSTDHFDLVVNKAGGEWGQPGDYLYTVFIPNQQAVGAWGLFRVGPKGSSRATPACDPQPPSKQYPVPAGAMERFVRQPVNKDAKP
jgi:hypothetical protein